VEARVKAWVERVFTWGNETFFPDWCKEEDHWTFKFLDLMWIDCPCCLLYRGVFVGLAIGLAGGALFTALLALAIALLA
jgi:hypothetical protein